MTITITIDGETIQREVPDETVAALEAWLMARGATAEEVPEIARAGMARVMDEGLRGYLLRAVRASPPAALQAKRAELAAEQDRALGGSPLAPVEVGQRPPRT